MATLTRVGDSSGFPGGQDGKEYAFNAGDPGRFEKRENEDEC